MFANCLNVKIHFNYFKYEKTRKLVKHKYI